MAVKLKLVEQCPTSLSNRHWAKFIRIQVGPMNILTSSQINFTVNLPFHGLAKAMAREDNKMEEKTKTVMQIAWTLSLIYLLVVTLP